MKKVTWCVKFVAGFVIGLIPVIDLAAVFVLMAVTVLAVAPLRQAKLELRLYLPHHLGFVAAGAATLIGFVVYGGYLTLLAAR